MTDTAPAPGGARASEGPPARYGATFWIALGVAGAFLLVGVVATERLGAALESARQGVVTHVGWMFLLVTTAVLAFVLFLAFSRTGRIRLGGPDATPEFGLLPWFAMLFQAGMGVGLLFWGIAEPVSHFNDPPPGSALPGTAEAADVAIRYSFFHWTLHPWAIYALVGLAVAYFSLNRGTSSLRISGVLRPLLGDRVDGPVGTVVDVVGVIATLFGVGVSLGLGTLQIAAGLGEITGLTDGTALQLSVIGVTAAAYMLSASTPISKGINYLSQVSMVLAIAFLAYIVAVGPTTVQLNTLTQGLGNYLGELAPMSLRSDAQGDGEWIGNWTIFFWATWIAWAPYVGAFIARISRGRTIREFVVGVLLAPSAFSLVWFSVLGASAIDTDRRTDGALGAVAAEDEGLATFAFLAEHPGFLFAAILVIVTVWIFFVSGADSGTVVLASMSGGGYDPSVASKLTWGVIMAALAGTLLLAGGLDALQDGAILAATPFAVILVGIGWSLWRALSTDPAAQGASRRRIRQAE